MAQGDNRDFAKQQATRQAKETAGWIPRPGRKKNPAKGLTFGGGAAPQPFGSRKQGKEETPNDRDQPPTRQPPNN